MVYRIWIVSHSGYDELKYDLNQALNDYKGLVCLRYPRGRDCRASESEKKKFEDYTFETREGSKALLVSYGRVAENTRKAGTELENEYGINCDVLKLNKIYPFSDEMVKRAAGYETVFFFEEGMKNGGIGEHLMTSVVYEGFRGKYILTAVEGFVKQASVNSQMKKYGLDMESIAEKVKKELSGE